MIQQLFPGDLPALCEHIQRHAAESGRDGDVIFRPRAAEELIDVAAAAERYQIAWARTIAEPQWMRTWALSDRGRVLGHLDLIGGRVPSELHRASIGMGLERAARGQGHGRALLQTAIDWARERGLSWIDLGVFAHNARARRLYESMGFVETGRTRDQFRVEGTSIDDIAMTLAL
ncbi:MAG: GNAT family N-acetyltransferase [Kofleriaceae bacterium]